LLCLLPSSFAFSPPPLPSPIFLSFFTLSFDFSHLPIDVIHDELVRE
jgi:hypothetical protein